jgi:Sec-independent protein translocase protein TatA
MSLPEIMFIGLLGLVIFGPKKLLEVGQEAGRALARLKKMSGDFQSQVEAEASATGEKRDGGRERLEQD